MAEGGKGFDFKSSCKSLVTQRAISKRKITLALNKLEADTSSSNVDNCKKLINGLLDVIAKFDNDIIEIISNNCEGDFDAECATELDNQFEYVHAIKARLAEFSEPPVNALNSFQLSSHNSTILASNCDLKLPTLNCDTFSGEGTSSLQYHNFLSQFKNIIGDRSNISDSIKLTYLKTYLRGYALKLIQHLQIVDSNYKTALNLLKCEFLNEKALIEDLIKKFFEMKPDLDTDYTQTKLYLSEIRCIITDLSIYGIDLMYDRSANTLASHVVFHKLPNQFKQELVR